MLHLLFGWRIPDYLTADNEILVEKIDLSSLTHEHIKSRELFCLG
jgi:hypothetical protein